MSWAASRTPRIQAPGMPSTPRLLWSQHANIRTVNARCSLDDSGYI
jgi:hypothetical protein